MRNDPQRAIDCNVGDTRDCKYTFDDMTYFDKVAIQQAVIKTKPYTEREKSSEKKGSWRQVQEEPRHSESEQT